MEKRIFVAILISIGFLWLWAALAPKLFPELAKKPEPAKPKVEQTAQTTAGTSTQKAPGTSAAAPAGQPEAVAPAVTEKSATTAAAAPTTPIAAKTVERIVIDKPDYTATFSNRGAELVSFRLKRYQRKGAKDELVDLVKSRDGKRTDYPFAVEGRDPALMAKLNEALYEVSDSQENGRRVIVFRYSDGRVTATKIFRFTNDPYLFDFSVTVDPPVPYRVMIGPGIRTLGPEEEDTRLVITGNGVVEREGKFKIISREKGNPIEVFDSIAYIGVEDNYFLSVLRPKQGGEGVLRRQPFQLAAKKRRIELYAAVNAVGGVVAGDAFFGPKETSILDRYGLEDALQFGWFGLIARFFLVALVWLNRFTKNYGFAIIVLTILIKVVLYPLQHKSIVSMKKMQRVQPKVEAVKAKYKKAKSDAEQRQKMNVEMMQLYQKEGINPMAGCLPMVIQLPILWGFYNLLSRAIELRGEPFIWWIHDLSDKDPFYITPILMTATMFIQTYITPSTGDPTQRKMFLIMPLVFGFMFKDFPSGLVLYWLVQNILTILQQAIMNKWWKEHPEELRSA